MLFPMVQVNLSLYEPKLISSSLNSISFIWIPLNSFHPKDVELEMEEASNVVMEVEEGLDEDEEACFYKSW